MKFHEAPVHQCSFPNEREKRNNLIYWVTTGDGAEVKLLEKRSGCELSARTMSCCCSKNTLPIGDVGAYLEKAYANGTFKQLVLMGTQSAMRLLRRHLSEKLLPLISTEIIEVDEEYLSTPYTKPVT